MKIIGITGGIGGGKSVVSRILRLKGHEVYDCDREAKRIMDTYPSVLKALNERFGDEVCPPAGPINRPNLAKIVFSSEHHLHWLNRLVHDSVRLDFLSRCSAQMETNPFATMYVESAILASSGLAKHCDEVWVVDASEEERIRRVTARDRLSEAEITLRIESQRKEMKLLRESGVPLRIIDNSGDASLLEQIQA